MKYRAEIDRLKDIRKIYGAWHERAELDVERSNAQLDRLDRQRDLEIERLAALEDGWQKAVTGKQVQLTASAFWSAEILRSRATLADIETETRSCQAARQALCETLRSLSARDDAVGALTDRVLRSAARRREEVALENHAGRKASTSGWGTSCE